MKIIQGKRNVDTTHLGSIPFGSIIQLTCKPEYWESYTSWEEDNLYLLTREYYRGTRTVPRAKSRELLIIGLGTGSGYPLYPTTQVIVRKDIIACAEDKS